MSDDGGNELTSEDKRILKHVADAAREEMPSRRGFIQGTSAAVALGALGFGTGQATAQTQPADGQVGTESNPVDVEAATVSAGKQSLTTRHIRVWTDSGDMLTTIDPGVSTPVQDALDAALAGGAGWIELPPGRVQSPGPIYMHNDVDIVARQSEIEITGSGTDGLVFDTANTSSTGGDVIETNIWGKLLLSGQGDTANTGTAIREVDGWFDSRADNIAIDGWNGPAWVRESGSGGYQRNIGYVKITNTDAGNSDGLLDWDSGGAPDIIHYLAAYPTDSNSGADGTILGADASSGIFGTMNVGGAAGRVINGSPTDIHGIHVRHINYEPTTQNTIPGRLVWAQGQGPVRVGNITLTNSPEIDYVYSMYNGANNYFGSVRRKNATINNNIVENRNDTVSPGNIICECKSTEIDQNSGGTLSHPISALGDLTMVS